MAEVEQAIFTSAETDRSAGYQVVARSPGVCEADAQDLRVWGPSHDSLLELGPDATSTNFHPLPSGAYCVSRTTAAGFEYSGRGGHRVYTQCLVAPPEVLRRFANNPFKLLRAAQAGGHLEVCDPLPKRIGPLEFAGGATPVDQTLLARLAASPGPRRLAMLVQAALDSVCLAVTGPPSAADLIAGLLSCLPVECRPEFSFSTGLKFSSRRRFRMVALSGDGAEQRWVAHQANVSLLDLSDGAPQCSLPIDGWARLIDRVATSGRISFLAAQLSKQRPQLCTDDLPALGLQLLEDFDASALRQPHPEDGCQDGREVGEGPARKGGTEPEVPDPPQHAQHPEDRQRADAAHCRFAASGQATATERVKAAAPSKTLHPDSPRVLQQLELLDDVVYQAVSGQDTALERLQTLWPQVLAELGDELVAESRAQYLHYALAIWEDCVRPAGIRNPARAVQALEVLCMLFDKV